MAMLVGGLLLYLIEHPLAWRLIMEPPFIWGTRFSICTAFWPPPKHTCGGGI